MFQPDVFFKYYPDHSINGKEDAFGESWHPSGALINSMLFTQREGGVATSLGGPSRGKINEFAKLIHRVPSVEGGAATSLGNLILSSLVKNCIEKNAPNGLFLCNNNKTKEGTNGA